MFHIIQVSNKIKGRLIMDVDLMKLRSESKRAINLNKQLKNLNDEQERQIAEIKNKYKAEMEKVKKQMKNSEGDKLYKKLREMYNEIIYVSGHEYEPEFWLNGIPAKEQEISTYQYFKNSLEKLTGKKLVLYSFNTPFTKKVNEYDEYDFYITTKRMYDLILMPKDVADVLCKRAKSLSMLEYEKIVKELPFVYLLDRFWADDNNTVGLEEGYENKVYVEIKFNDYKNIYNDGIFEDTHFNKNDVEYEKIVLDTFKFWYRGKTYEKYLEEKKQLEKKIKQMQNEQKRLAERKRKLNNLEMQMGVCK